MTVADEDICSACGQLCVWHFHKGTMVGCVAALKAGAFKVQHDLIKGLRSQAISAIVRIGKQQWFGVVADGGGIRHIRKPTRRDVETEINNHYNALMHQVVAKGAEAWRANQQSKASEKRTD